MRILIDKLITLIHTGEAGEKAYVFNWLFQTLYWTILTHCRAKLS